MSKSMDQFPPPPSKLGLMNNSLHISLQIFWNLDLKNTFDIFVFWERISISKLRIGLGSVRQHFSPQQQLICSQSLLFNQLLTVWLGEFLINQVSICRWEWKQRGCGAGAVAFFELVHADYFQFCKLCMTIISLLSSHE